MLLTTPAESAATKVVVTRPHTDICRLHVAIRQRVDTLEILKINLLAQSIYSTITKHEHNKLI